MNDPRYQRRKEERPQQIAEAAFEEFARHGYAQARVEDVAQRAGVSKGLMYLYFRTKEELFKAVIRNVVTRRVDALIRIVEQTELPAEDFVRGPMLEFMQQVPDSRVPIVIRLLLSEGARHPDLLDYYRENVVEKGLAAIRRVVERGIERGEFRPTAVNDLPQLFLAPMILSVLWTMLFDKHKLDADKLMATQLDLILDHIRARPETVA
jgi:AcrR family transcriptional regulator